MKQKQQFFEVIMNALQAFYLVHDPKSCNPERRVWFDPVPLRIMHAYCGLHYRNFWLEQSALPFHLGWPTTVDRTVALDRYFAKQHGKSTHRTMIGSHSIARDAAHLIQATGT